MTKKEIIHNLFDQNSQFLHSNQSLLKSTSNVSSDTYTDPKKFLIGMIKNADEASFEQANLDLNITFSKDSIVISHQGKAFTKEDIESLCYAGSSTKTKNEELTDHKSSGFESIFAISNKVIINSNDYCFRFEKDSVEFKKLSTWTNKTNTQPRIDNVIIPWQITPIWTEEREIESLYKSIIKDYNVNLIIFLKEEIVDKCRDFIHEIEKDNTYFLFLKSKNLNFTVRELFKRTTKITKKESERLKIINFYNKEENAGSYYLDKYEVNIQEEFGENILEVMRKNSEIPKNLIGLKMLEISFAIPIENESINGEIKVKPLSEDKRIIYSYEPTTVNCNFPFLINTNFTLDTERNQLTESSWNFEIFRILPSYITKFQKKLFFNFGNSFSESLCNSDSMIFSKKLKEIFVENTLKEKDLFRQDLNILTSTNSYELLRECYLDSFKLEYKNTQFNSILFFFYFIFEDEIQSRKILEEYFIKNKSFRYSANNEILERDRKNIEVISKYFDISYRQITNEEILSFIESEEYKKYTKPIEIWRLLCVLSKSNLFDKIISGNNFRFPDVNNEFRKANSLMSPQINYISEKERSFSFKINVEEFQKFEINHELLKTFISQKDIYILEQLKVNFVSEEKTFEFVSKNLDRIYNETNTIDMVQIMFKKWKDSNIRVKKSIINKFNDLENKFLILTKGNLFIHCHCAIIGKFYNEDSIFDDYLEHSISEEYFIPGTDKNEWTNFFIELKMWHKDQVFLSEFRDDTFDDMPFIDKQFKILPEVRIYLQKESFWVYVSPMINRLYEKSFEDICKFFQDNIHYCNLPKIRGVNENNFLNYFKWFFTNKPIPTTKNNLKNAEQILSKNILEDKSDLIKMLLEENLEFAKYDKIYYYMKDSFKRDKLNCSEIILILSKIQLMEPDLKIRKDRDILINYYFTLCCELAELKITPEYNGFLIDCNEKLCSINELYYITNPEIETLIGHKLEKKYSKLKVPEIGVKNFLNFCRKNGLKIYDESSVSYNYIEKIENIEIENIILCRRNDICQLIKMNSTNSIDLNSINKKFEMIKFYNCKKILIETTWKDSFEQGVCFCEAKRNIINFYLLKDDVYSTWKHPSIMHHLTSQLCKIFGCKELHADLITLFNMEKEEDIKNWILDLD